jgi:hypothetical protein
MVDRAPLVPTVVGADAARSAPVLRFASLVRLTKDEVFAACQALADADRHLVRAGRTAEADALGDLFELFEERLAGPQPGSGSYSMESEFTQ